MKHCPAADCPDRRRERAAEYADHVAECAACGTPLVLGAAPGPKTPARPAPAHPAPWKQLCVTLAVPLALGLLTYIPIPGLDGGALLSLSLEAGGGLLGYLGLPVPLREASILALGVMPLLSAYLIVEVVCLAIPRWRRLRIGGPDARVRLRGVVLRLSVFLAAVQGLGIAMWLESFGGWGYQPYLVSDPGLRFRLLAIVSLTAGTALAYLGVQLVDRFGLGNGFSVVLAGELVLALPSELGMLLLDAFALGRVTPFGLVLVLGAVGAMVVVLLRLFRRGARATLPGERPPLSLPHPTAGIVPLGDSAAAMALIGTGASLMPLPALSDLLAPGSALYLALDFGHIVVLALLLTVLFNRPSKVATLYARLRGDASNVNAYQDASVSLLRSALPVTVLSLLLLRGGDYVVGANAAFTLLGATLVAVLTAVVLDLADEWRALRDHGSLVVVWPLHRVYAVAPVTELLESEGIDCHLRGYHHRTLMHFFGPHVAIDVRVPEAQAARVHALLSARLLANEPG